MNQPEIYQDYNTYSVQDHNTWASLFTKHFKLLDDQISTEYSNGFEKLNFDKYQIVDLDKMSLYLEQISGWSLVPVSGLIPTQEFFFMIVNKKYPVTVSIRSPLEIHFSEQPDIFHDVCGHVPLLVNEKFTKFLTAFSTLALKYVNNEKAMELLGRFYWYTYEMGLINEDGKQKYYGGAIITSIEEKENVQKTNVSKRAFNLDEILKTPYNPFKIQNEYFVINSFEELFGCLDNLEVKLLEFLLLTEVNPTMVNYTLNRNIGTNFNNVIGFLNDIQFKFPSAISFVAGQPDEDFFDIENNISKFGTYVEYQMKKTGKSKKEVINNIGQYNKTKGIINELLSEYLRIDENIKIAPDDILITVGAQEAFSIIISTICNKDSDIILIEDPSYIGVSSFAQIFDYTVSGVKMNYDGMDLSHLKAQLFEANNLGKQVKLVYVIPDYQNPTGATMTIENRIKLLELARQYNFLIIEDTVYNSFTYSQKKNPTLKSLDKHNRVIYVGSFSKSLFPGIRLGMIAANQTIENTTGTPLRLIDEMAKVKAQFSNNTPTINQAILGGILIDENFSLNQLNKPKFESYKRKRDHMVNCLKKYINQNEEDWAKLITWNEPDGGFFIKMCVPFDIKNESVVESARDFEVIFCPMRNFYISHGGEQEIRLTFSNLTLNKIDEGVRQLALYLKSKIQESTSPI